jgi:hypothetical protein
MYVAWQRVEFILWPTVSRPVRLSIGLPLGAHDQILSLSFPYWQLLCWSSCRVPSLTRGQVYNLQCNRWLVRSLRTSNHTLPSHLRLCSLFVASYDSQGLRWRYSIPPPHGLANVFCGTGYQVNCDGHGRHTVPSETVPSFISWASFWRGKRDPWNRIYFLDVPPRNMVEFE